MEEEQAKLIGDTNILANNERLAHLKQYKAQNTGQSSAYVQIAEVEMDESTQTFQSQLSVPVVDPATGEVIGAVTVGVDVDALMQ